MKKILLLLLIGIGFQSCQPKEDPFPPLRQINVEVDCQQCSFQIFQDSKLIQEVQVLDTLGKFEFAVDNQGYKITVNVFNDLQAKGMILYNLRATKAKLTPSDSSLTMSYVVNDNDL